MKKIAALLLGLGLCLALLGSRRRKKESKGGAPEPSLGWEWTNFVILAGLFTYLAVTKGGPFFNTRAAEIRKGIDDANKIKSDSDAKIAAINSKLGRLDSEIASLRESAAAERRGAEQRLKEDTQREIQRIGAHADSELDTAGKSERVALQRYAAKLALELAETKVRARMNPNAEDALVQAFVHGLVDPGPRPQTAN